MRRLLALLLASLALPLAAAPPLAAAGGDESALRRELRAAMRQAGGSSGIWVLDATERHVLYRLRDRRSRVLASNTKLFTTAAALAQYSPGGTLKTSVVGAGEKLLDGSFDGDLYLRGGGDPSFGADGVRELARQVDEVAQIERVSGRVLGDESVFDSRRGGPDSNFGPSPWHAPLSALSFGGSGGRAPAELAAARFRAELEDRGVDVRGSSGERSAPDGAIDIAAVESPPMARLVRATNKSSSNFFAEMLLKAVGAADGDQGTTRDGARDAAAFARRLGASARLADGSGLSRGNRASPRAVGELLDELRDRPEFDAFFDSLSIAGVDGTLAQGGHSGLRGGPARRRCRGKTGTLSGVSALSGYCRALSGDTIVFSILSNGVNTGGMKRLEDRMLQAIARYG